MARKRPLPQLQQLQEAWGQVVGAMPEYKELLSRCTALLEPDGTVVIGADTLETEQVVGELLAYPYGPALMLRVAITTDSAGNPRPWPWRGITVTTYVVDAGTQKQMELALAKAFAKDGFGQSGHG